MAILSDSAILAAIDNEQIVITPFNRTNLGTNSYDVTLGDEVRCFSFKNADDFLDTKVKNKPTGLLYWDADGSMFLYPERLYLAHTNEWTETYGLVPVLEGKSSLARLGMEIHRTAGFGDAGFCGQWTLEITVVHKTRIHKGMKIGQLVYHTLEGTPINTYDKKPDAKYSGQTGATESQMYKNFEEK